MEPYFYHSSSQNPRMFYFCASTYPELWRHKNLIICRVGIKCLLCLIMINNLRLNLSKGLYRCILMFINNSVLENEDINHSLQCDKKCERKPPVRYQDEYFMADILILYMYIPILISPGNIRINRTAIISDFQI